MHFLFLPYGTPGDVYPYVGIGVGLKNRGHRVTFITHTYFADLLARYGLEHADLNDLVQHRATVFHPDYWHATRGVNLGADLLLNDGMRKQYAHIERLYAPGQTIAVVTALSYGAMIAAEKLGMPLIHTFINPFLLPSISRTGVQPVHDWVRKALVFRWMRAAAARYIEFVFLDRIVIGPRMNKFRQELGLPPIRRLLKSYNELLKNVLGLYPRWLAEPILDDWPAMHFTGFPFFDEPNAKVPPDLAEFLDAGDPPIAFSPGSATTDLKHFFEAAVFACQKLNRRGLVMTRFPEQLPLNLPPTVKYVPFAPHTLVLPRCAAVVSHGGVGTVAQGLRAGIPQVCMPLSYDQPDIAERCRKLGVSRTLPPRRFTGSRLTRHLHELLTDPAVREQCQRLAASLVTDDPVREACDRIEEFAVREGVR
jgi:UDP:flavonoid glycosyltransferase YjiC (YdhE family)